MGATELIIVSDIFGRTPALQDLASELSGRYDQLHIIDPYDGQIVAFDSEPDAYHYFQKHCSIEKLAGLVHEKVAESNALFDLVGFSVGASAIWSLSETRYSDKINTAVCFYGSRIRNMLDKVPRFKIRLIFPVFEHQFDVARLISVISKKTRVECIQTKYMHGFMNKRSENFDDAGYREFFDQMKYEPSQNNSGPKKY